MNAFVPVVNDTFDVTTYPAHVGIFSTINITGLGKGLFLCPDYTDPDLTLTVAAAPCP